MAQTAYSELLKIEPNNVLVLNNLAFVLAERGQFEDAIQTVDTALSLIQADDALYGVITQTRSELAQRVEYSR
jgi:Flp pilus assembly protein TadD